MYGHHQDGLLRSEQNRAKVDSGRGWTLLGSPDRQAQQARIILKSPAITHLLIQVANSPYRTPSRIALSNIALSRLVPNKVAPVKFAELKFASLRNAPVSATLSMCAWEKSVFLQMARAMRQPAKFACAKLASVRIVSISTQS